MTVSEIIKQLSKFPADAPVMVPADWAGYDDAGKPELVRVLRNAHTNSHCGKHDDADGKRKGDIVRAVVMRSNYDRT